MKCISCETEINPQWTHAIDINVCPFCGKHIMEEHLKNLFSTLRETMDSLQSYPDQVNDWMLSNHNYIKTNSADIVKYMPAEMLKELKKVEDDKDFQKRKESQKSIVKVKTDTGEEEVLVEKIQSEERTQDFFKRAEVIKRGPNSQHPNAQQSFQSPAEKTEHLKKVAQQIKRVGSQGLTDPSGGSMNLSAEMMENADPEAVAEFQQMISGSGEVASSLDSDMDDDLPGGESILAANQAIANNKFGGSGGNANAKDLAHLQRLQAKVSQARNNISSGAKGSFSRS
jgi:Zn-finger nucleic acid-binding protein